MKVRKFQLADAMILVAATAAGLAITRAHLGSFARSELFQSPTAPNLAYETCVRWQARLAGVGPLLMAWSAAVLLLLLRTGPRRGIRKLARSSGPVACLAAGVGLIFWALDYGRSFVDLTRRGLLDTNLWPFVEGLTGLVGPCVGSSWICLALAGRWRARPGQDWRDRAGRWLGFSWLALYVLIEVSWISRP